MKLDWNLLLTSTPCDVSQLKDEPLPFVLEIVSNLERELEMFSNAVCKPIKNVADGSVYERLLTQKNHMNDLFKIVIEQLELLKTETSKHENSISSLTHEIRQVRVNHEIQKRERLRSLGVDVQGEITVENIGKVSHQAQSSLKSKHEQLSRDYETSRRAIKRLADAFNKLVRETRDLHADVDKTRVALEQRSSLDLLTGSHIVELARKLAKVHIPEEIIKSLPFEARALIRNSSVPGMRETSTVAVDSWVELLTSDDIWADKSLSTNNRERNDIKSNEVASSEWISEGPSQFARRENLIQELVQEANPPLDIHRLRRPSFDTESGRLENEGGGYFPNSDIIWGTNGQTLAPGSAFKSAIERIEGRKGLNGDLRLSLLASKSSLNPDDEEYDDSDDDAFYDEVWDNNSHGNSNLDDLGDANPLISDEDEEHLNPTVETEHVLNGVHTLHRLGNKKKEEARLEKERAEKMKNIDRMESLLNIMGDDHRLRSRMEENQKMTRADRLLKTKPVDDFEQTNKKFRHHPLQNDIAGKTSFNDTESFNAKTQDLRNLKRPQLPSGIRHNDNHRSTEKHSSNSFDDFGFEDSSQDSNSNLSEDADENSSTSKSSKPIAMDARRRRHMEKIKKKKEWRKLNKSFVPSTFYSKSTDKQLISEDNPLGDSVQQKKIRFASDPRLGLHHSKQQEITSASHTETCSGCTCQDQLNHIQAVALQRFPNSSRNQTLKKIHSLIIQRESFQLEISRLAADLAELSDRKWLVDTFSHRGVNKDVYSGSKYTSTWVPTLGLVGSAEQHRLGVELKRRMHELYTLEMEVLPRLTALVGRKTQEAGSFEERFASLWRGLSALIMRLGYCSTNSWPDYMCQEVLFDNEIEKLFAESGDAATISRMNILWEDAAKHVRAIQTCDRMSQTWSIVADKLATVTEKQSNIISRLEHDIMEKEKKFKNLKSDVSYQEQLLASVDLPEAGRVIGKNPRSPMHSYIPSEVKQRFGMTLLQPHNVERANIMKNFWSRDREENPNFETGYGHEGTDRKNKFMNNNSLLTSSSATLDDHSSENTSSKMTRRIQPRSKHNSAADNNLNHTFEGESEDDRWVRKQEEWSSLSVEKGLNGVSVDLGISGSEIKSNITYVQQLQSMLDSVL